MNYLLLFITRKKKWISVILCRELLVTVVSQVKMVLLVQRWVSCKKSEQILNTLISSELVEHKKDSDFGHKTGS